MVLTIWSGYGLHMLAIWSGYGRHLLGGARRAEHRETQDAQQIKVAKGGTNAGTQKRARGGQEDKNTRQLTSLAW